MSRRSLAEILIVGALLLVALVIRFAYHHEEMLSLPFQPDGYEYHRLAQNLLRGRGYGWIMGTGHFYRYARTPGYPLFIALVYGVTGINPFSVRIADLLLSVLSILFAYLIAKRLFGRIAGVMAAFLLCLYWRAVVFSADYYTENLFVCLVLGLIYLLIRSGGRFHLPLFLAGLLLGYAIVVRPNAIGFLPALILWILSRRLPRKKRIVALLILVASSSALPVLLAGYNWMRYSAPPSHSLASLVGSKSLWQAHNPEVGDEIDNRALVAVNKLRFAHFNLPEEEWASLLKNQSRGFFLQSPRRCLRMAFLRFRKHWLGAGVLDGEGTIYPETGKNRYGILYWYERFWKPSAYFRDNEYVSHHFKKRLMIGPLWIPLLTFEGSFYILFLCLLISGLLHFRGFFPALRDYLKKSYLLLLMILFYVLFHFMGFVHHRIRFPLEPLICMLAGGSFSLALGGLVRFFVPRLPPWFYPGSVEQALPIGRIRPLILLPAIMVALIAAISLIHHVRYARGELIHNCALTPEEGEIASAIYGEEYKKNEEGPDYQTLQRYRAHHFGSVEPFIGKKVLWTGEATYLRKVAAAEILHEPPPYRKAWKMLNARDAPEALLVRLVMGSYRRPDHHGRGEALLITVPENAPELTEGDSVTVQGRIAGADNDVMGYPIVALDRIHRWTGNAPLD